MAKIRKGNNAVREIVGSRRRYLRRIVESSTSIEMPADVTDVSDLHRIMASKLLLQRQIEGLRIRSREIEDPSGKVGPARISRRGRGEIYRCKDILQSWKGAVGKDHRRPWDWERYK